MIRIRSPLFTFDWGLFQRSHVFLFRLIHIDRFTLCYGMIARKNFAPRYLQRYMRLGVKRCVFSRSKTERRPETAGKKPPQGLALLPRSSDGESIRWYKTFARCQLYVTRPARSEKSVAVPCKRCEAALSRPVNHEGKKRRRNFSSDKRPAERKNHSRFQCASLL